MLNDKVIWVSGGTGSFGNAFVEMALKRYKPKKIIIFSRDEFKQYLMKQKFGQSGYEGYKGDVLRFQLGDVRSHWSVQRSMKDVDIVIHTAALKQIDTGEYNANEFIETNVKGTQIVCESSAERGVKKVVCLTTDKAVAAVNLYGKTKSLMDSLVVDANVHKDTIFTLVRYGNVAGSRGSIIPRIRQKLEEGYDIIPITDSRMTRFWITLEEAVEMVLTALEVGQGGETFIPKMPSFKLTDLVEAMCGNRWEETGIRPGEKLHEDLITEYDDCYDNGKYWIVYPTIMWKRHEKIGIKKIITLDSCLNDWRLTQKELKKRLETV
jgi:UDP-N-acetylglucosamine 4,6-dehydratase/5-epimerase